jgi:hypothetical protein
MSAAGVGLQLGKFAILQFSLALRLVSLRKCRVCIGYMNVIHMKQETVPYHRKYQTWRMQGAETTSEISNATGVKAVQDAVYKAASFSGTIPCQTITKNHGLDHLLLNRPSAAE